MYATPVSQTRNFWPFAAICCLSIIGFVIAATIAIALIPIYLSKKEVTVANDTNNIFFLEYSADANIGSSLTGSVQNLDEIANALGFGGDAKITEGLAQATFQRRKRGVFNRRQKRTLLTKFRFRCEVTPKSSCISQRCHTNLREKVQNKIQQLGNISNFPCSILSGGILSTLTFSLTFLAITALNAPPIGFGTVTSFTFVAVQNGAFNDPLTWAGGIVPYGECSVVIPTGITVSLARSVLEIPLKTCDVYGSLALGSGSSSFTFNYPPNVIVHSGATVQDLTSSGQILIPPSSLVTLMTGGLFTSATTVVLQTYSSSGLGSNVTLTSNSGPFTCGVLPDDTILSFNNVTFIATQSGDFTSGSTYLGGNSPSTDICSLSGCGLCVPSGCTLSTADLSGTLNIDIDEITVLSGGILQLGTSGLTNGFNFSSAVQLNVYGLLSFLGTGSGIFLPVDSVTNFFTGGSFSSTILTFIQVFDPLTGVGIGTPLTLAESISGPYFVTITINGTISTNGTNSGETNSTTSSPTTTASTSSATSTVSATSTSSTTSITDTASTISATSTSSTTSSTDTASTSSATPTSSTTSSTNTASTSSTTSSTDTASTSTTSSTTSNTDTASTSSTTSTTDTTSTSTTTSSTGTASTSATSSTTSTTDTASTSTTTSSTNTASTSATTSSTDTASTSATSSTTSSTDTASTSSTTSTTDTTSTSTTTSSTGTASTSATSSTTSTTDTASTSTTTSSTNTASTSATSSTTSSTDTASTSSTTSTTDTTSTSTTTSSTDTASTSSTTSTTDTTSTSTTTSSTGTASTSATSSTTSTTDTASTSTTTSSTNTASTSATSSTTSSTDTASTSSTTSTTDTASTSTTTSSTGTASTSATSSTTSSTDTASTSTTTSSTNTASTSSTTSTTDTASTSTTTSTTDTASTSTTSSTTSSTDTASTSTTTSSTDTSSTSSSTDTSSTSSNTDSTSTSTTSTTTTA